MATRKRSYSSSLSPPPDAIQKPRNTASRAVRAKVDLAPAPRSGPRHVDGEIAGDGDATHTIEGGTVPQVKGRNMTVSRPQTRHEPTDEFQQVTKPDFVDRYKVEDLGYGGDVYYQPSFIAPDEAMEWYGDLLELDTYQPMLKMYGRTFPQSRQIAAYSTSPNATLSYSGSEIVMHHPLPQVLERIRLRLEDELGVKFNHVMLNRYEDGGVYIGKHSDNLNNLVIASVSLGARRTFIMSPRLPSRTRKVSEKEPSEEDAGGLKGRKNVRWVLENGSLVVMQGRTQEYWKHEIPKEPSVKEGRISLTFRQLV